jgi:hypothetical protein
MNIPSTLQQLNQVLKLILHLFDDILKRLSNTNPIVLSIFSYSIYCLMNSSQRKQLIKFPMVMTHIPRGEIWSGCTFYSDISSLFQNFAKALPCFPGWNLDKMSKLALISDWGSNLDSNARDLWRSCWCMFLRSRIGASIRFNLTKSSSLPPRTHNK